MDIQPPDYETRMAILRKKEELEGYNIDNEVIKYIASNVKSNIRELEGALTKIVAFSKLNKREINTALAEEALKDLISPNSVTEVTPELIIKVVSEHFGITPGDIVAQKRSKELVFARQIAMYLCGNMTNESLQNIGKALGGRDHTTIIHGTKKIVSTLEKDETLRNTIDISKKENQPAVTICGFFSGKAVQKMWITQDIFSQVPARFQPVDNSQVVLRFCPGYSHARKQPKSLCFKAPNGLFTNSHPLLRMRRKSFLYIAMQFHHQTERKLSTAMKLTFKKDSLLNGINIVLKAVPSKTTMPILECILIDASSDEIKLTANDMELGIETKVDGNILEKGKIALDAKLFSEIIRKLSSEDSVVTIDSDEKFNTVISCENSVFKIQGRDGEEFSYLPYIEKNKYICLSQFSLKRADPPDNFLYFRQ